jgi:uncharacterized membrane protein YgcG
MGLQQVLLLVLSVILVGVAIAVGIVMFNYHAFNANRQAIFVELEILKTKAVEYWSLPESMGGAGQNPLEASLEGMASYLGFVSPDAKVVHQDYVYVSENGEYHLNSFDLADMQIEVLGYTSFRGKFPHIALDFNVDNKEESIESNSAKLFNNGSTHTNNAGGNGGGNNGDDDDDGNNGSGNGDDDDDDDDDGGGGGNGGGHGGGGG